MSEPTCEQDEELKKTDPSAISGAVIMLIIILGFITAYLVFRFHLQPDAKGDASTFTKRTYDTLFGRLEGFFGGSIGEVSIGMLVAILVSNVVGAFNGFIIEPIVRVSIPNQDVFSTGVDLGRGVSMPIANFFLSLLSFFISLLLLFFIIEGVYQISKLPKIAIVSKYLSMVIVILLLLGIVAWNIYDVSVPKCTKIPTSTPAQAMTSSKPLQIISNPMGGMVVLQ